MNYEKQSLALSNEKKQHAEILYKCAVSEIAHKNYTRQTDDAFVELSAIFGQQWLITQRGSGNFWMDFKLFAEANIAFNYANLINNANSGFIKTAKEVLGDDERVCDKKLKSMAQQMKQILTKTTEEEVAAHFRGR